MLCVDDAQADLPGCRPGPIKTIAAASAPAAVRMHNELYVFVVAADSTGHTRVHEQPVQSGSMVGDEVLILSGLAPGQRVATSGSFKLREAVLVAVAGDSLR